MEVDRLEGSWSGRLLASCEQAIAFFWATGRHILLIKGANVSEVIDRPFLIFPERIEKQAQRFDKTKQLFVEPLLIVAMNLLHHKKWMNGFGQ